MTLREQEGIRQRGCPEKAPARFDCALLSLARSRPWPPVLVTSYGIGSPAHLVALYRTVERKRHTSGRVHAERELVALDLARQSRLPSVRFEGACDLRSLLLHFDRARHRAMCRLD